MAQRKVAGSYGSKVREGREVGVTERQQFGNARASALLVTAVEVIEHLENPSAVFRELYRLLRSGGVLVCLP